MEGLVPFLILLLSSLLSALKSTLQGYVSRRFFKTSGDGFLFHALFFSVVAGVVLLFFPISFFGGIGVLLALFAAMGSLIYQVTYAAAMKMGKVSLTVLITNFSVLLTTLFSVCFFGESVYWSQLLGVALLVLSMLFNLPIKKDEADVNGKWLFFTLVALLSVSFSTVLMKVFVSCYSDGSEQNNAFIFLMYAGGSVAALVWYLFFHRICRHEHPSYRLQDSRIWCSVLAIGVLLAVFQRLYTHAMGTMDGGVLFPMQSGLTSLVMAVIGVLLFGDRLRRRQILGVICGILSVILLNLNLFPVA